MAASTPAFPSYEEYPPRADLRKMMAQQPLPIIAPETVDAASLAGEEPTKQAFAVLDAFNAALAADDAEALESCFFVDQSYWRDQLALTYHLRTFTTPGVITASLLETKTLRGLGKGLEIDGEACFIPASPCLQFIDCGISFRTESPAAKCSGKILLLPVKTDLNPDEPIKWKIWILSTRLESLDLQPEDESLLQAPARRLDDMTNFDTDVFIIGGGNAAITLAARLKALGVESVMVERNAQVGDNWALRYDCMRFHVPTSFCEMPYMCYDKKLQTPHLLTRDDLAEQVRRYVQAFNLNIITSAKIQSTVYDQSTKRWTIKFHTPNGLRTAVSKHLVQATGIASQKPHLPQIADAHLYKGINIHSTQYKSAAHLKAHGAKTVLIIGSANTAFDILQDTHAASLHPTLHARTPTYILPLSYLRSPLTLGAYDALGVPAADRLFLTLPTAVDSQLARNQFARFAAQEPDRYAPLAAAGFPVVDSGDPGEALMRNLVERAGGHYIDVGGTGLVAEGRVGVKAGVEAVGFVEGGVRFGDGSVVGADAVVWCTGFADRDARDVAAEVMGAGAGAGGGNGEVEGGDVDGELGPREIAARLDATWGVDDEGEIRGMWKRHLRVENYWIAGGFTQQHRWHSHTLAVQIKAALEGILPPAYRGTGVKGPDGGVASRPV